MRVFLDCRLLVRRVLLPLSVSSSLLAVILFPSAAAAHEGHAALPSTGATIEGNQILISSGAWKGLGVEVDTVTLRDLSREIQVRAQVELPWEGAAMVTTLVPGRVDQLLVQPGESVRKGQPLARIASFELESLQLDLLQAAEEVTLLEKLVDQQRQLAETGVVAGKRLLEAETQLRQKQLQLLIARRKLAAVEIGDDRQAEILATKQPFGTVTVSSPIDGLIAHADVRIGEFVDTEQHLFNVANRTKVWGVGEVLETDAWRVAPGQKVAVHFSAVPGQTFEGRIDRIRLSVDPQRHSLQVVVPLDNPDGNLRPGLFGHMAIQIEQVKEAIACPTAAINATSAGRQEVLLRQGEGKFERREVELGLRVGKYVEVKEGLFPGDRVVVTGTKVLAALFHRDHPTKPHGTDPAAGVSSESVDLAEIPVAQSVVEIPTGQKAFATPVVAGRIVAIHVQPGQSVERGQLLAELDSQELRGLQLDLLATAERLRRVTDTIHRLEPLVEGGQYPEAQLWKHELEQKKLAYQEQNLERKLAMIGLDPEQIAQLSHPSTGAGSPSFGTVPVLAPQAGSLADFEVVTGEIVHENDVLFQVQDRRNIWVEGHVFERHAPLVEIGQIALVTFPAFPELKLKGTVIRLAPSLHDHSRVLPLWIELENPGEKLREGMLAKVRILSRPEESSLAGTARTDQGPP